MTKLNKLLHDLCPDGVEYKSLEEIFDTRNGYTPSKSNPEYWDNGTIPWFRMEDIRANGRILTQALQYVSDKSIKDKPFPANSIIVATSATIGEHALLTVESLANQRFTYLILKEQYKAQFDIKFLYYYCFKLDEYCLQHLKLGNFASVDMSKFAKFLFPIPPLEVQQEIVRILDQFTQLTAELTAELTARKRQYMYYRNKVLSFEENIQEEPLRECGILSRGEYITKKESRPGNIPVILGGQEPAYYIDHHNHTGPAIVVSRSGASAGFISYWDEPIFVTDGFIVEGTNRVDIRFLYHFLKNGQERLNKTKRGGGVPHITGKSIGEIKIPVPPLSEQRRIVAILDRFDALCNDLTSGLPAEIAARQKQYEYYRDKLLTFPQRKEADA